jgi:phage gp29-like protein
MVAPALRVLSTGGLARKPPTGAQARSLPRDASTDHPGYGCTPSRLVAIYRDAELGSTWQQCELFDDIVESDAHLRNLLEQRAQAVAGKPRVIKTEGPDPEDALAAAALADAIRDIGSDASDGDAGATMSEVIEHLLAFNRYGFSACELFWKVRTIKGRDWIVPYKVKCAPPRRFAINPQTEELLLINDPYLYNTRQGVPLWPGKWITVRRAGNRVARSGLMRTATINCLSKRYATRDLTVYSEKFGLPLPIVTYEESNDDAAKEAARLIAENIGNDGAALVPKGIEVQIVDAVRSDSSGVHMGLITHINRENSKLINGSTLSNDNGDSGGASYALGDVHASIRWEAVQYDAERLQDAFRTQISVPFCVYNNLDSSRSPILQIQVVRDLDPKVRVDMGEKLLAMNVALSLSQMRQDSGFAAPINDEDTIKPIAPVAPAAPGAPASPRPAE